jgi:hypothetical protein
MANHVKIIRAKDFLIATPQGQVDFEKSKCLLKAIAFASTSPVAHEVLLDMRKSKTDLSATNLWNLAAELSRGYRTFRGRIAVLSDLRGSGKAAFFALCAQNRGYPVSAFTSFEEAVEWLTVEGATLLEYTR